MQGAPRFNTLLSSYGNTATFIDPLDPNASSNGQIRQVCADTTGMGCKYIILHHQFYGGGSFISGDDQPKNRYGQPGADGLLEARGMVISTSASALLPSRNMCSALDMTAVMVESLTDYDNKRQVSRASTYSQGTVRRVRLFE